MLLKYLNKKVKNYENLNAMRIMYFIDFYISSFFIWKFGFQSLILLPNFKKTYFRSFYKQPIKFKRDKRLFLYNLYFFSHLLNFSRLHNKNFPLGGSRVNFNVNTWTLLFLDRFESICLFTLFLQRIFIEKDLINYFFDCNWSKYKLKEWSSIPIFNLLDEDEFNSEYDNYFILDGHRHWFQYKIVYSSANIVNFFEKKINNWLIKSIFLRLCNYPVVYKYRYLFLLENLSIFEKKIGLKVEDKWLPWELTLQEDGVWQFDEEAVALINVAHILQICQRRGEFTELLMKDCWLDFYSNLEIFGLKYKKFVLYNRKLILQIIKKVNKR